MAGNPRTTMTEQAAGGSPAVAEPCRRVWFRHPLFASGAQLVLAGLFLFLICRRHSIYEEDEPAKVAQIIWLGEDAHWKQFHDAPDYYRKEIFSAYYFAATAFYKLSGFEAVAALNLFSVVCGAVFFAVTPAFFRRAFGLPPWLSWIALLGSPVLVSTFSYGNETALALAAVAFGALALTLDTVAGAIGGALGYVIAVYSRSDYLLLGPALGLLAARPRAGKAGWRQGMVFGLAALLLGLGYLLLVLEHIPRTPFNASNRNWKLVLAFLFYAPNPANVLLAAVGLGVCLAKRRGDLLLALSVLLQALPYATMLTSPKYVLPTFVMGAAFTVVGMQVLWRRSRLATVSLLALPWLVGITPFGIFGPTRAAFWSIPSDHGPVPVGGYIGFFTESGRGLYDERYGTEYREIDEVMGETTPGSKQPLLVGFVLPQSIRLWAAKHRRWDIPSEGMPFVDSHFEREKEGRPEVMLRTGYLYPMKEWPAERGKIEGYLNRGSVVAVAAEADPFPGVIQIGSLVPAGTDSELGQRILFMNAYAGGEQVLRMPSFDRDLAGVCWMPHDEYVKRAAQLPKPMYVDGSWACFSDGLEGGICYSMRFPKIYSRFR
jgi:MFS family permease